MLQERLLLLLLVILYDDDKWDKRGNRSHPPYLEETSQYRPHRKSVDKVRSYRVGIELKTHRTGELFLQFEEIRRRR